MIFRMDHEASFKVAPVPPADVLAAMTAVASVYGAVQSVSRDGCGGSVTVRMETPEEAAAAMAVLDGTEEGGVCYAADWA